MTRKTTIIADIYITMICIVREGKIINLYLLGVAEAAAEHGHPALGVREVLLRRRGFESLHETAEGQRRAGPSSGV
jgi:hypothetical protein